MLLCRQTTKYICLLLLFLLYILGISEVFLTHARVFVLCTYSEISMHLKSLLNSYTLFSLIFYCFCMSIYVCINIFLNIYVHKDHYAEGIRRHRNVNKIAARSTTGLLIYSSVLLFSFLFFILFLSVPFLSLYFSAEKYIYVYNASGNTVTPGIHSGNSLHRCTRKIYKKNLKSNF